MDGSFKKNLLDMIWIYLFFKLEEYMHRVECYDIQVIFLNQIHKINSLNSFFNY